jgi:REP element-mobilizing transposase RayT
MEVSIPNTMSVLYVVRLLKGYSPYEVFKEMPRHRLRYFK